MREAKEAPKEATGVPEPTPHFRGLNHERGPILHAWFSRYPEYQGDEGQALLDVHLEAHAIPAHAAQIASHVPLAQLFGVLPQHEDTHEALDALHGISRELELGLYTMSEEKMNEGVTGGRRNGFYNTRDHELVLRSNLTDAEALMVWAHELGHVALHRGVAFHEAHPRVQNVGEVEAQSVAFLLLRHLGVDASQWSAVYLSQERRFVGWRLWRRSAQKARSAARLLARLAPEGAGGGG